MNALQARNKLAVELRKNKAGASTSGVRNVFCTSTGTTEVTTALWAVEDHLVTSVCVNSGHDTGLDSSEVVETRRQVISGAKLRR